MSHLKNQNTLLDAIEDHQTFSSISRTLSAVEQYQGKLPTADPAFIELQLLQMEFKRQKDQSLKEKVEQAIEKLQRIVNDVQQYNQTVNSKLDWIASQNAQLIENSAEIQEEIDLIHAQLCKQGYSTSVKGGKMSQEEEEEQLKNILQQYGCRSAFPRNKTQMLMLINQIEAKIQQLEMQNLSSYQQN